MNSFIYWLNGPYGIPAVLFILAAILLLYMGWNRLNSRKKTKKTSIPSIKIHDAEKIQRILDDASRKKINVSVELVGVAQEKAQICHIVCNEDNPNEFTLVQQNDDDPIKTGTKIFVTIKVSDITSVVFDTIVKQLNTRGHATLGVIYEFETHTPKKVEERDNRKIRKKARYPVKKSMYTMFVVIDSHGNKINRATLTDIGYIGCSFFLPGSIVATLDYGNEIEIHISYRGNRSVTVFGSIKNTSKNDGGMTYGVEFELDATKNREVAAFSHFIYRRNRENQRDV